MNGEKSDSIPTLALLAKRKEAIISYWKVSAERAPERFWREVRMALAADVDREQPENSFKLAFRGLIELAERLATAYGSTRWEPSTMAAEARSHLLVAEPSKPYGDED